MPWNTDWRVLPTKSPREPPPEGLPTTATSSETMFTASSCSGVHLMMVQSRKVSFFIIISLGMSSAIFTMAQSQTSRPLGCCSSIHRVIFTMGLSPTTAPLAFASRT